MALSSPHPDYRLYGRRQDKPLTARQQRLMETLLPKVSVTTEGIARDGVSRLNEGSATTWLELGFGGGEHLAWQARVNPDVLMIGAEPFINGVAKLLTRIDEEELKNIRILHGDGRPLIAALPDGSLSRAFILHPDPWPKKRHFKRRIVSPALLEELVRLLKPGSILRIASDVPDYVRWSLMQVEMHNRRAHGECFRWLATAKEDWTTRPEDWPQTRYEAKAIREGRTPVYLQFERL